MHSIVIIRPSILQVMLLKYMKLPHQGQSFKSWQRSWRQEFQNHDTTCCRTRKAGLMQGISIYRERTRKLLSAHQHVQVLLSLTLCEWQQYELHRKRFISQSNNNFLFSFQMLSYSSFSGVLIKIPPERHLYARNVDIQGKAIKKANAHRPHNDSSM